MSRTGRAPCRPRPRDRDCRRGPRSSRQGGRAPCASSSGPGGRGTNRASSMRAPAFAPMTTCTPRTRPAWGPSAPVDPRRYVPSRAEVLCASRRRVGRRSSAGFGRRRAEASRLARAARAEATALNLPALRAGISSSSGSGTKAECRHSPKRGWMPWPGTSTPGLAFPKASRRTTQDERSLTCICRGEQAHNVSAPAHFLGAARRPAGGPCFAGPARVTPCS